MLKQIKTKSLISILLIIISLFSCGQIDPNKQIDEGNVENDVYTSSEIGWTMKIPKGWDVISKEETQKRQQKGLEVMQETAETNFDASSVKNLICFKKNQFNIFQSTSEPFELEYEGEWQENNALLKQFIYQTYGSQGMKVDTSATTTVNVDGLDFKSYKFTIYSQKGDVILNQIMYSTWMNGLDFGVNINYNNETDKKEMMDAWMGSKFRKNKPR